MWAGPGENTVHSLIWAFAAHKQNHYDTKEYFNDDQMPRRDDSHVQDEFTDFVYF